MASITKLSIMISSPRAYLSRNWRAITWVSDYRCPIWTLYWFSNRTGTSFDDGARSKNTRKELGRLRRCVLTEMWFSKEVRRECMPMFWKDLLVGLSLLRGCRLMTNKQGVFNFSLAFLIHYLASNKRNTKWFIFVWSKGSCFNTAEQSLYVWPSAVRSPSVS